MLEKILENNRAEIVGEIASEFEFSHTVYDEAFYFVFVKVSRFSRVVDMIPVLVSERLMDVEKDYIGKCVQINGQFRSHVREEDGKNHLELFFFARDIEFFEELRYRNLISLDGYICKVPTYRTTPSGRELAEVFLAVNRSYKKSDYIPCILWGRDARYVKNLPVGSHIQVRGRIQSRQYQKYLEGNETEIRTVYEVSVNRLRKITEE